MPYHWQGFTPPRPHIAAAPVEEFVTAAHTNASSYLEACRLWAQSTYPGNVRHYLAKTILYQGRPLRASWVESKQHRFMLASAITSQFKSCSMLYSENLREDLRVCIQRNPDRTPLRLTAAGLDDGTPFLWLRYDRKSDLPVMLAEFGLTKADVIDLDAIKLPPRPKAERKPQLRRLKKVVGSNFSEDLIDLNQGGLYCLVERFRRGRPSYAAHEWDFVNSIRAKVPALGAMMIVLPRPGQLEHLQQSRGWTDARSFFKTWLEENIDWSAPTRVIGNGNGLNYRVETVASHFTDPRFPEDVRAFGAYFQPKKDKPEPNEVLYDVYRSAFPYGRVSENLVTNETNVTALFSALKQKYPLFEDFIGLLYTSTPSYSHGAVGESTLTAVAEYLTLKNGEQA